MRATKATLKLDRISLIVHWVMLTVAASYLGWLGSLNRSTITLLSAAGGWILLLTIISFFERRLPYHRIAVLVVDLILAFFFFRIVAANGVGLVWAGLLPILTAVLYFRFQGGALVSIGWTLMAGVTLSIELGNAQAISSLTVPGIILVLIGLAGGMISQQVGYYLQNQQEFERIQLEKTSKQEQDRIRALYKIISSLTATLNFQKVLDRSLDIAADVLISPGEENLVVSAVLLFEEDELYIGSARRLTPSDYRKTLPGKAGIIIESLKAGQPRRVNDFSADPELQILIALRSCQAGYVYPLRTSQDLYGALVFGHPEANFFDETRGEILEIIGRQSLAALQNANLYTDLEQEKERIIDIQEDARKQLARDLHDGPTQSVAAIAMRVNFARRLIERDVNKASDELYKIEDLARRATKEIRHMLFTLRPLALETGGLLAALTSMAEKTHETYGQKVIIEAQEEMIEELEIGRQGVIFFIAEEAVNNARKHAEAEAITIRLKKVHHDVALLEIEDNGVGFNVGEVDSGYEKRGSLGMVNMRERTELLNGVFQLTSEIGMGTLIRVWIPITEDAAERIKRGRIS